jgi:hypothetical protein
LSLGRQDGGKIDTGISRAVAFTTSCEISADNFNLDDRMENTRCGRHQMYMLGEETVNHEYIAAIPS